MNKYNKPQTYRYRDQIGGVRGGGLGMGEIIEGDLKELTSSYNVNNFWDVMYSSATIVNTVSYIKRLLKDWLLKVLTTRK